MTRQAPPDSNRAATAFEENGPAQGRYPSHLKNASSADIELRQKPADAGASNLDHLDFPEGDSALE